MSTDLAITLREPVRLREVADAAAEVFALLTGMDTAPPVSIDRISFAWELVDKDGRPIFDDVVIPDEPVSKDPETFLVGGDAPDGRAWVETEQYGAVSVSTAPRVGDWGPEVLINSLNHTPATYVLMVSIAVALMERWGAVLAEEVQWLSRQPYPTAAGWIEELRVENPTGDIVYGLEQVLAKTGYRTG